MNLADKVVASVLAGIHGAHVVKLADQHSAHEVIDCERIVGILVEDSLEILDCVIVIEVVEALKGTIGKRVAQPRRLRIRDGDRAIAPGGRIKRKCHAHYKDEPKSRKPTVQTHPCRRPVLLPRLYRNQEHNFTRVPHRKGPTYNRN